MKKILPILTLLLCTLISCEKEDYGSRAPQFDNMLFLTEAGYSVDTITAGQTIVAGLNTGKAGHNVYYQGAKWTLDGEAVGTPSLQKSIPMCSFTVPAVTTSGWRKMQATLTYGVSGNSTEKMPNYKTDAGLSVEYSQAWAGQVGHYVFTCTKKVYVKAAPIENSAE